MTSLPIRATGMIAKRNPFFAQRGKCHARRPDRWGQQAAATGQQAAAIVREDLLNSFKDRWRAVNAPVVLVRADATFHIGPLVELPTD